LGMGENDSGTSETSPIVHDASYTLEPEPHRSGARRQTGDLIWESHVDPTSTGGSGSPMRSTESLRTRFSFLPITDTPLCDARTGEILWTRPCRPTARATKAPAAQSWLGQDAAGDDRWPQPQRRLLHQAIDVTTGKRLCSFRRRAQTGPDAENVGHSADGSARGRRNMDRWHL